MWKCTDVAEILGGTEVMKVREAPTGRRAAFIFFLLVSFTYNFIYE